jgi:hypothetical protein
MRHNYRRWLLGLAGAFVGLVSFAFAADFDPVEVDEAFTTAKNAKLTKRAGDTLLKEVLQGTKQVSEAAVKTESDRYLQKFLIPSVVQPDRIRDSDKSPRNVLLNMFGTIYAPNANGRQYLLDTTLAEMTKYARGNYAPQVRAQAYLMLGDLNTRERSTEKNTPPLPLAAALKILLDDFEKPNQPDGIQGAILVGLVRHAHLNANDITRTAEEKIQAADLDRLEKIALALIAAKGPPTGRSAEGHEWLRRRGAELAGHLAASRPSPKIVAAVEVLIADRKDSPEVRLAAAESLAQIARRSAAGGPQLTIKPLAQGVALAIVDTLNQRFDKIDKDREKVMTRRKVESLLKSRAATGTEGKYDKTDPYKDHTDPLQRWAAGKIISAWTGLVGVPDFKGTVKNAPAHGLYTGTPAAADKQALDDVKKELYELWEVAKNIKTDSPMEDAVESLRTAVKELEAATGVVAEAPKPAPTEADGPPGEADAGKDAPAP